MTSNSKSQKVYAFIDSQNLYMGIRDQGWKLDFKRFRQYLQDKYKVCKAYMFIGYLPGNESLYHRLFEAGFFLIFKPTVTFRHKGFIKIKGNVDVELSISAVIEMPNFDSAIVVSGDGDFYFLLEVLRESEKLSRVIIPNREKYSRLLFEFNDYIDFLGESKNKLEKK